MALLMSMNDTDAGGRASSFGAWFASKVARELVGLRGFGQLQKRVWGGVQSLLEKTDAHESDCRATK